MLFPYHDDNPTSRFPVITVLLIIINVAVTLYVSTLDPIQQRNIHARFGFIPARVEQLTDKSLVIDFDLVPDPEQFENLGIKIPNPRNRIARLRPRTPEILRSLLTSLFLHGGLLHLASNMWFFWIFGNNIEDRIGKLLFVFLYLGGGILASICHYAMTPAPANQLPVIGASGAVAVTLGAYAVTYPTAKVRVFVFLVFFFTTIKLPAMIVLGGWFAMQLVQGFNGQAPAAGGGVAWWAHVGGFVAGLILIQILDSRPNPYVEYAQRTE